MKKNIYFVFLSLTSLIKTVLKRYGFACACLLSMSTHGHAETEQSSEALTFSGYLETYYVRDFNRPDDQLRPLFTYSHNQANNLSINLALIRANLKQDNLRLNLGLGSGSYMRANYALERNKYQNIFEANLGIKLSAENDLWLDVGVMPSHIGFESAIGVDNWTMTRSIMADNSPYFETGAKLSYTTEDGKWFASGLLLTGWQRISAPQGNTTPAIGHQLTYKPNDSLTLNSSSFIGNDKSDRARQMRYFHNFYAQMTLNDRWSLITAFDIGAEQKSPKSDDYHVWYTPVLIARYIWSDTINLAARYEYYQDKNGVIIATSTPNGFKTHGYSFNLDYQIYPKVMLRTELRGFNSRDAIFEADESTLRKSNLMLGTALAISF